MLPWPRLLKFSVLAALLGATGCGGAGGGTSAARPAATPRIATAGSATTSARPPSPHPAPKPHGNPSPRRERALPPAHGTQPSPPQPTVVWDPIPFGPRRRAETAAYVERHYGSFMQPTWLLSRPQVIVIHYTDSAFASTLATFIADTPDAELHELPGTCAHFLIDTAGTIHQLVPLDTICRHTVGLNWTAIGIEHVGFSDAEVLGNRRQLSASLKLVRWLQCRFHIQTQNVIGHNESLSSPFHREDLAALRTQTHGDFNRTDMDTYRAGLRNGPCG